MTSQDDGEHTDALSGRRTGSVLGGRFRLGRILGEGGFGVVYEAFDETTGQDVAVKLLHVHLADVREVAGRFRREAAVIRSVQHPNVVTIVDAGVTDDGTPFFAMERLRGTDLASRIEDEPYLRVSTAVRILMQVAEALRAVHAAGIVHRDLKPDNVFLVHAEDVSPDDALVKLLDFGVAKVVDGSADVSIETRTGATIGTAYYMSPEQAMASKDVDARSDVYSLGVILFRMLAGTHPFDDVSYPLLLVKICTEPPPSIARYRADVPPGLVRLLDAMLSKDRATRPQTAADLLASLARFVDVDVEPRPLVALPLPSSNPLRIESPLAHAKTMASDVRDESEAEVEREAPRRSRWLAIGVVLLALAICVIAVAMRRTQTQVPDQATRDSSRLPRPMPPEDAQLFGTTTTTDGYRFLNPLPRALPTFLDVAIAGPGVSAFSGRAGALFTFHEGALRRIESGVDVALHGLVWAGADELVAVGERGTILVVHDDEVRRIDAHVEATLRDVVALGPREWIVVGDRGTFLRVVNDQASVIQLDRESDLLSVMRFEDGVLAVGGDGTVVRWDRRTITAESSGTTRILRGIAGCSPTTVYAVGDDGVVIHRRADAGWEPVATRSRESYADLVCRSGLMYAPGMRGGVLVVAGLSSTRLESGDERSLYAIDAMPGSGVWAVGAGGRMLGVGADRVVRFTSGSTKNLFDVATVAGAFVAVGADGIIVRRDDDGFVPVRSPVGSGLGGIATLDEGHAVAVGDIGTILLVGYREARILASPTQANLRDVVARDGTLLAVGEDGTVVRGSEGAFAVSRIDGGPNLRAIGGDPVHALAVGDEGTVVRFDGSGITTFRCDTETSLRAVFVDGERAFAAGQDGVVARIDGNSCAIERRSGPDLGALGPHPNGGMLALGERGRGFRRADDGTYEPITLDTGEQAVHAIHADPREVLLLGEGGLVLRTARVVVPSEPGR